MKSSSFKIAILLCGFITNLIGQQSGLVFHHLKLNDGLSQLTNQYVYKDSRGFIWISSTNGLNRYDGTRIKVYLPDPADPVSLYGENIQSNFFEDDSSRIWFCTYDAINCYEPALDAFSQYYMSDSLHQRVPGYHIFHRDTASNLWMIIEYKGIFTFNTVNKNFRFISPMQLNGNRAVFIKNSSAGRRKIFLFEYNAEGIEEINIDADDHVTKDTILKFETLGETLKPISVMNDGDSILWIAGKNEFIRYRMDNNSFGHKDIKDILSFANLNDTAILISIADKGVWEYNKLNASLGIQHLHENWNPGSVLTNRVNYMSTIRDGGIWMSSSGLGLSFSYPEKMKFSTMTPREKSNAGTTRFTPVGFYEDSLNNIFCATSSGGIYTLDRNGQVINEWLPDKRSVVSNGSGIYKTFRDRKKNIWLSTYKGLMVIPSGTSEIIPVTGPDNIMWNAVELNEGKLIFSARTKWLYEVISKNGMYDLEKLDTIKFPNEYITIDQDSKGAIWICEKLQKYIVVDPVSFTILAELPVKGVSSHLIEKKETNTVWISNSSGLYEIDSRNYTIKNIYNAPEYGCAGFNNMLEDEQGRLWLTCNNQIAVFDPATNKFHVFNEDDGMPGTPFRLHGAYRFKDGEMWFGYSGGITRFYPDKIKNINIDAIPQITTLLVNDLSPTTKIVCEKTKATNISEIEKLSFPFRDNTLSFVVNSLEYSAPQHNKVRYKMDGIDKDWIEVKSGSLVRYPALHTGKFTFLVQAANSDGVYSSIVRKLDIAITPPFYKTWWFIALSTLAILALIVYIVYLNFSKKLELQKVRLRLYENLHDDVGSRLTAIVLSAEDMVYHDTTSNPKLERISKIAKSIVGNMRRLVWAIDPENDSMNSLVAKIRHDSQLILDDSIDFHIDIYPQLMQMPLPGEIRYQLTSIINEALNNISKYAFAKNVWVRFTKSGHILEMSIQDDGVGFNAEEVIHNKVTASGYGLGNMQKRIGRVKGVLAISSKPGEGTTIEVKIPVG